MKTAIIEERYLPVIRASVVCPYCKEGFGIDIPDYVCSIRCIHCKREFRVVNPEAHWDTVK